MTTKENHPLHSFAFISLTLFAVGIVGSLLVAFTIGRSFTLLAVLFFTLAAATFSVKSLNEAGAFAKLLQSRKLGLTLAVLAVLTMGWFVTKHYYGVETIDHFFERDTDYYARYYVNLFLPDHTSRNYRAEADIFRTSFDTSCADTSGGFTYSCGGRVTYLTRVYFPDGGSTIFSGCEVRVNEKTDCTDDADRAWTIELTNIKAAH